MKRRWTCSSTTFSWNARRVALGVVADEGIVDERIAAAEEAVGGAEMLDHFLSESGVSRERFRERARSIVLGEAFQTARFPEVGVGVADARRYYRSHIDLFQRTGRGQTRRHPGQDRRPDQGVSEGDPAGGQLRRGRTPSLDRRARATEWWATGMGLTRFVATGPEAGGCRAPAGPGLRRGKRVAGVVSRQSLRPSGGEDALVRRGSRRYRRRAHSTAPRQGSAPVARCGSRRVRDRHRALIRADAPSLGPPVPDCYTRWHPTIGRSA